MSQVTSWDLKNCAPSRWVDFSNIKNDQMPSGYVENEDLFVGKDAECTLTLTNGTTYKVKDLVVLGKLTIKSSNPADHLNQPMIIFRNMFIAGNCSFYNTISEAENCLQCTRRAFFEELDRLFLEWSDIQRETTKQMGLRSILVIS
ncbi:MAG TPA: hypothetical protein VLG76_02445 [Rhabdochlamydiaceae bacterium]|nr:hypothetical protein [Rhabdochlamydiaceae bacterium]